MKPLYYILPLLLLVLASCTPKGVNFFGVPIEGTLDEFLTAIDGTTHIALDSANIEYFEGAYGTCTFMGMPMEFYLASKEIEEDGLPSSRVQALTLVGADTVPIEIFTKHYGKEYKVNSGITYWSFENGEVGFGWKFNQIYLHFYRK